MFRLLSWLPFLAVFCAFTSPSPVSSASPLPLTLQFSPNADVALISFNNSLWLETSPLVLHLNGKKFSTSNSSSSSSPLVRQSITRDEGEDSSGSFERTSVFYLADQVPVIAHYRLYQNSIIFSLSFPLGANQTALVNDTNAGEEISTEFPSFVVQEKEGFEELGFFQYSGPFGWYRRWGKWSNVLDGDKMRQLQTEGIKAGPVALFNRAASLSVFVAPIDNFMDLSAVFSPDAMTWGWGVGGNYTSFPLGFSYSVQLYFSSTGVVNSISGFGADLRRRYNKLADAPQLDPTNTYLGYSTDNGAYYYYNTEAGENYEQTILDVHDYAVSNEIPYKWVLLDSWWYYKGTYDGVKNWTSMPDIFPNGLLSLHRKTGWLFAAHNRYFSTDTNYAIQNGGEYEWKIDEKLSLPLDQRFWNDLMNTSLQWGLRTYEQDWLFNTYEGMKYLQNNIGSSHRWLYQMATAAQEYGINIQYCMPYARHILQSVAFPAVTQIRASDDHLPGSTQLWIGETSILISALGAAPYKDNFWSNATQPGNPYQLYEKNPYLEAMIAVWSLGPVASGDQINMTDVDLIMQTCRADGLILRPDAAAVSLDATFANRIWNPAAGYQMGTYSSINDWIVNYVLVVETEAPFEFEESQLPKVPVRKGENTGYLIREMRPGIVSNKHVEDRIYHVNDLSEIRSAREKLAKTEEEGLRKLVMVENFGSGFSKYESDHKFVNNSEGYPPPQGPVYNFFITFFYMPFRNGFTLIGEYYKMVPISKQRIQSLEVVDEIIPGVKTVVAKVGLIGMVGEMVTITWSHFENPKTKVFETPCQIQESGHSTLVLYSTKESECIDE